MTSRQVVLPGPAAVGHGCANWANSSNGKAQATYLPEQRTLLT
jgi:hypothetical protein